MLLNCGVGEDSWESLGLQGDPTSPSWRRSVLNIHWKDCCWCWSSNTSATWCEELTHWKRPWHWERLKVGEGDDRGWDGWMASPTQWTWVWVNSGSWWWTGRPGCCSSWGRKELDTTEWWSWTELIVFLVVTCSCESWTIKKAESWRTDAFELWCWRRLLRVPWNARRSNQSILKEISPEYSFREEWCWRGNSSTLVTWCEELTHWKRPGYWERLKARGEGYDRGWNGWMASPTQWTWVWVSSGCWWWTGRPGVPQSMGSQRVGHDWATELNWKVILNTLGSPVLLLTWIIFNSVCVYLQITYFLYPFLLWQTFRLFSYFGYCE